MELKDIVGRVPSEKLLYSARVLLGEEYPGPGFDHAPSAVPFGRVRISVFGPSGRLWAASPGDGGLVSFDVFEGSERDERSALPPGAKVSALFGEDGRIYALAGEKLYEAADEGMRKTVPGEPPRQRIPYYYASDDPRTPAEVRGALLASAEFEKTPFLSALGNVSSVFYGPGELYVGTGDGLMLFRSEENGLTSVETFSGGRYMYENDCAVTGAAVCGDGGLWIGNARGFVRIDRPLVSLSEKAEHFRAVTAALHCARGSVCDINYTAIDSGNGGFVPSGRYSTNNDGLWALLDGIADGMRLCTLLREGDEDGAEAAADDMRRILQNILLQSRIHGRGDGFVCRGYVSVRDRDFVRDGHITQNGLWFRKGHTDENGLPAALAEDTPAARLREDIPNGRRHLLTSGVRARFKDPGETPADGDFRLASPAGAPVPERLAALYKNPDPVWPEAFPACRDDEIIYKADTSSEEVIAAFVMYYFAWKHLLRDSRNTGDGELLELVKENAAATLSHLLDNGYRLIDAHGNPTQWGKWDADYFKFPFSDLPGGEPESGGQWRYPDYAFTDASLNSAEIMCIFKVTAKILEGDERYAKERSSALAEYERCFAPFDPEVNGAGYSSHLSGYRKNLLALGAIYVKNGGRQLREGLVPPQEREQAEKMLAYYSAALENGDYTPFINYSDEELALLAFWPLLELETEPGRLETIKNGFLEWWDNMRRETNPIYTFFAAALLPETKADTAAAADALYRLPWRLTQMPVLSSVRNDVVISRGSGRPEANRALPTDERRLHKSNSSPFTADFGNGEPRGYGKGYLYSGNIFTLPYWTARYYGLL